MKLVCYYVVLGVIFVGFGLIGCFGYVFMVICFVMCNFLLILILFLFGVLLVIGGSGLLVIGDFCVVDFGMWVIFGFDEFWLVFFDDGELVSGF